VFSEGAYVTIDDKYDKRVAPDSRYRAKQFTTSPPKRGKTNDVTFQPFSPLMVGEKYVNANAEERKYRAKQKEMNIVPAPFKPSSPPKRSTGLGTYFGTIGPKWQHECDHDTDKSPRSKFSGRTEGRNITTSQPKKGTYGVPGTNIGVYGGKAGNKGVVGEYEYKGEPYDLARQAEQAAKKRMDAAKIDNKAFKPSSPPKKGTYGVPGTTIFAHKYNTIGGNQGVCGEYTYWSEGKGDKGPIVRPKTEESGLKPFRPSHPPRAGYNCTISPFPEYKGDPLGERIAREKKDKEEEKKALLGPVFKPVSGPKSTRTPSIANHPLNRSLGL